MNSTSRIMGYTRMVLGIFWLIILIAGLFFGLKGFSWIEIHFEQIILTATQNIGVVRTLIDEITDVIDTVEQSFGTVERTLTDAGLTLDDSRPMIDKSSEIITQEVPQTLDDVQDAMPSVVEAAAMVDQSLRFLSLFQFTIPNPFGDDWEISLGIDYDPPIPFEDAIVQMSSNLEGLPDQMRAIETDMESMNTNMAVMSEDLLGIADDLDQMRTQIADINPELDKIILSLDETNNSFDVMMTRASNTIEILQKVFIGFMVLLILSQIPAIYIGYMFTKKEIKLSSSSTEMEDK